LRLVLAAALALALVPAAHATTTRTQPTSTVTNPLTTTSPLAAAKPRSSEAQVIAIFLDLMGLGKLVSQALAIILVTPLNFLGNKLWSFRH